MIMWSSIEACASVICANLPCYAPLLAPLLKKAGSIGVLFTSLRSMFSLSKKDSFRSVSSKKSTQKETSSSEKIIPNPTVIESGTKEDTKYSGRGTDMEMGRITHATKVDAEAVPPVSKPLPHRPCLNSIYSAGFPSYGSSKLPLIF